MNRHINYTQLAAEFVIVFVGVAVALAADEWRQGLQERKLEQSYLARLENDLNSGRERILVYRDRFDLILEATNDLIQLLENDKNNLDASHTFDLAVRAAQSGVNLNALTYSATYDELLATGNLAVIGNDKLRTEIVNHFRQANGFVEEVEDLPLNFNVSFKSFTGYAPFMFSNGEVKPTVEMKERLVQELRSNERLLMELRIFHGELGLGNIFGNAIESIDSLLRML